MPPTNETREKTMTRVDYIFRLALLVGVAVLLSTVALSAQATCELSDDYAEQGGTGTGGTGVRGDEGSGTGGTGLQGDEGSGTGGTGVLGVVTGFGSVCVNGLRIGYDEATTVEHDGRAASAKDLAVGHVVRVTAAGSPLRARRIAIESTLSGPVTRFDAGAGRVWVMGQPVELSRAGRIQPLEPGVRVDVSGQRREDGVVVASRVDRRESGDPHSAIGVAVSISRTTAYVGELRAQVAPGDQEFASGDRVVVRGRWNDRTGTLEDTEVRSASVRTPETGRLSLQGFVAAGRAGADFHIAGVPVDASGLAAGDRNPSRDAMVRVRGKIDREGRLRAERIRIERRGPGVGRHDLGGGGGDGSSSADRSDREDREDRGDRSGSGRGDRPDREERPERSERPERQERPERPDHEDNSGPG